MLAGDNQIFQSIFGGCCMVSKEVGESKSIIQSPNPRGRAEAERANQQVCKGGPQSTRERSPAVMIFCEIAGGMCDAHRALLLEGFVATCPSLSHLSSCRLTPPSRPKVGIGVVVSVVGDDLVIDEIAPGGPAAKEGEVRPIPVSARAIVTVPRCLRPD